MTIIPRYDNPSRPCDVTLSWHLQSVERNAPSQGSSAIYWRWQYVHGGRSSRVCATVSTRRNAGDIQGLDRSNLFGAFKALRSLLTPLVQAGKQSPSRVTQALHLLWSLLAHDEQETTGARTCSPQIKGT